MNIKELNEALDNTLGSSMNEARISVDVLKEACKTCFAPLDDGDCYYVFTHNGSTLEYSDHGQRRVVISVNSANEMLKCLWAIQSYRTETTRGFNLIK